MNSHTDLRSAPSDLALVETVDHAPSKSFCAVHGVLNHQGEFVSDSGDVVIKLFGEGQGFSDQA